ncbi:flagellar biosynthesis protein FliR [Botrimarina colliarenosi]|uniref:Flagellar biosynthesis protein FliR n=1 Tax=Botrimarina colliarenosi TaxID=2528001 RepID=A0A5C6AMG8_9BACT|nr:flagellar biosynthetic protein FliR [Botrimarina colliarenosi]TWU00316.1 flagellar biosynthesis protein FliR [Botrimarina colliarenosi]
MSGLETQLTELGVTFALILARVGAVVATAPVLSDKSMPLRLKVLMAVAMAGLVTPMTLETMTTPLPTATTFIELGALAGKEVVVGLALGLGLMVVLSGVQLTGQIVGQMSGMALAEGADPVFGDTASVFGQIYYLVVSAVFVAAGGLNQLIDGLLETLRLAPPGSGFEIDDIAMGFIGLLGVGFELGVRTSAPLLLALFLATLVLGLISRTLPQINTMVVGFGINAMLTLGVMMASMGAVAYAYQGPLTSAITSLADSVGAP